MPTLPTDRVPDRACRTGTSPVFTEHSVPAALRHRHSLAPGNWARLVVLAGGLVFVDLDDGSETRLAAGDHRTIPPAAPHRVVLPADAAFRLEFFRERG